MNKTKYINIKSFEIMNSKMSEIDRIDNFVLLYDILSNQELIKSLNLLKSTKDDIIIESILTILYKRACESFVFLFLKYLFIGSKRIRFICIMFLNDMGIFKNNSIQKEFLKKEKDNELINLFTIINDIKEEDYTIEQMQDYVISNFKNNDIHAQLEISFKIKNITFEYKKETIIELLYKNNDYSVSQNLLYALCTEELTDIEKKNINNILIKKDFYSELIHDLKMLNLFSPELRMEHSLFKRCATLIAAIFGS